MRRALGLFVVVIVLMVPALIAGAIHEETTQQTYKDHFDAVSYSGNNGSLNWSGPWVEETESDGPGSGAIRVVSSGCSGKCLEMRGGLLSEVRVRRAADLSGFLDATIHFNVDIEPFLASTGVLYVEVKDGSAWPELDQYPLLLAEDGSYSVPIDSKYLDDDFEFRFCLGQLVGGDRVYIDDVKIIGSVPVVTTTTSSTTPTTTTSPTTTSTSKPAVTTTPPTPTTTSPGQTTTTGNTDAAASVPQSSTTTTPTVEPTTTEPTTSERDGDDTGQGAAESTTPNGPWSGGEPVGSGDTPALGSDTSFVPEGSGLRLSRVGLLADFRMGDLGSDGIEVLGVSLDADFSLAAEAFEATRLWIAGLALLIAVVLVSGMDMRRARRMAPGLLERGFTGPIEDRAGSETEE